MTINDIMREGGTVRDALFAASPYCLDSNNRLVAFNEDDQKIFDTYLQNAAGQEQKNGKPALLSNEERLHLLQIIALDELQKTGLIDKAQDKDTPLANFTLFKNAPKPSNDLWQQVVKGLQLESIEDKQPGLGKIILACEQLAKKIDTEQHQNKPNIKI
jgi:hypothetical protein